MAGPDMRWLILLTDQILRLLSIFGSPASYFNKVRQVAYRQNYYKRSWLIDNHGNLGSTPFILNTPASEWNHGLGSGSAENRGLVVSTCG